MQPKHLISIRDLSAQDVTEIFRLAADIKASPEHYQSVLSGKTLALLFQMPSTRTRASFQIGMYQMGGLAVAMNETDTHLGRGESLVDTAVSLSRYVHGIVLRARNHAELVEVSRKVDVPVINGLTDLLHPCQAIVDYFTLTERKGALRGHKMAYVGDGNNMCHSLIYGANKVGMDIVVASPEGYEPKGIIVKSANREAKTAGVSVVLTQDPAAAVHGADAVYTDTWVSMGRESEGDARAAALSRFRVDADLFAKAKDDAVFMHCLPVNRQQEVAPEVVDGPRSLVPDQIANHLPVQKAILYALLAGS